MPSFETVIASTLRGGRSAAESVTVPTTSVRSPTPAHRASRSLDRWNRSPTSSTPQRLERSSPQPPSRLERIMGHRSPNRSTARTASPSPSQPPSLTGHRPVMVWLHGGGYSSGGGSLPWYDGGALSAEGDVVVVSVNYRVGVLGYLLLDGVSEGNLGGTRSDRGARVGAREHRGIRRRPRLGHRIRSVGRRSFHCESVEQ